MTRRQFLTIPRTWLIRPAALPALASDQMLDAVRETWPGSYHTAPEPMTPAESTAAHNIRVAIDEIHTRVLGEHSRWLRWIVWRIGGNAYPPAKGEL